MDETLASLLSQAKGGDRRALARLLTLAERGGTQGHEIGAAVFGSATGWVTGVTGAPGAGKSTLTGALVGEMRQTLERVAVIAVDPSSPFSGGAILGDRVRMQSHTLDEGVFIRSMATRGHLGGLAVAVPESIRVLQTCGYRDTIIETVGVGQVEVDIASEADTTIVVVNPGWGDAVQANKAGLMEIADIFVINKADRPGAEATAHDLQNMLALTGDRQWQPPIVSCVALEGDGIAELWEAMASHRAWAEGSAAHTERRERRLEREMGRIIAGLIRVKTEATLETDAGRRVVQSLLSRQIDPWTAAAQLVEPD